MMDILTDLVAADSPFLEGSAHGGIVRAALWIFETKKEMIDKAIKDYPSYSIQVVGHSLGAGVAVLISLLLQRDGFTNLHCWAYSPPKTVDPILGAESKSFVTSFIYHNDFCPRLSYETVNKLRQEINKETKETGVIGTVEALFGSPLSKKKLQSKPSVKILPYFGPQQKVVIPGTIYHIGANGKPGKRKYCIFEETNQDRYNYIKLSKVMISDHMPDSILFFFCFSFLKNL